MSGILSFGKDLLGDAANFGKEMVGMEDVDSAEIYDVGAGKKKSQVQAGLEDDEDVEFAMPGGDYLIQVHIMEGKDLIPPGGIGSSLLSNKEGSASPLVRVSLLGQKKSTQVLEKTLQPIFNETLHFHATGATSSQLEMACLQFDVMDHNSLLKDTKIGSFVIDLPNIHSRPHHEAYHKWAILRDLNGQTGDIKGYLKLSISIIGKGERPYKHKKEDKLKQDVKDNLIAPNLQTPKMHVICIHLLCAEDLICMDLFGSIDPFVKGMFGGKMQKSKVLMDTQKPQWNESLFLTVSIPSLTKCVKVELWDHDAALDDDRVGSFKFIFKEIQNKNIGPKWYNIYGAPSSASGVMADYMTKYGKKGSTYRGRICCSMQTMDLDIFKDKKQFVDMKTRKVPLKPPPTINYTLRCDVFEGHQLPKRNHLRVHILCGVHELMSKSVEMESNFLEWNQNLKDMTMHFPEDPSQIPDIIVYLATSDDAHSRICYARIKAKKLIDPENPICDPLKIELQEDKSIDALSDEEFAGYLYIRIGLFSSKYSVPHTREAFKGGPRQQKMDYRLRIELSIARDLPPADESGASDPKVIFRLAGGSCQSSTKYRTLNPNWYESIEMKARMPKNNQGMIKYDLTALVYDVDDSGNDLIGIATIPIEGQSTYYFDENDKRYDITLYKRGAFYPLIYPGSKSKSKGTVYLSYHLIPEQIANKIPLRDIHQPSIEANIQIGCVGLRDGIKSLNMFPLRSIYFVYEIEGDTPNPSQTNRKQIQNGTCNILESSTIKFLVPLKPKFAPRLSIYAYDNYLGAFGTRCLGLDSMNLDSAMAAMVQKAATGETLAGTVDEEAFISVATEDIENTQISPAYEEVSAVSIEEDEIGEIKHTAPNIKLFYPRKHKGFFKFEKDEMDELQEYRPDPLVEKAAGMILKNRPLMKIIELIKAHRILQLFKAKYVAKVDKISFKMGEIDPRSQKKKQLKHAMREMMEKKLNKQVVKKIWKKGLGEKENKEEKEKEEEIKMLLGKMGDEEDPLLAVETHEREQLIAVSDREDLHVPEAMLINLEVDDTIIGEEYDKPPDYLIGRPIYENKEFVLNNPPFSELFIKRGSTRGITSFFKSDKTAQDNVQVIGKYKAMTHLNMYESEHNKTRMTKMLNVLKPTKVIIRVYILEGRALEAKDSNNMSDPYIKLTLGKNKIYDKKSLRPQCNNPKFYVCHELVSTFPGDGILKVAVMDDDGFGGDDLIGKTIIDLEDRYYSREWQTLPKKPIEERLLTSPSTSAPQGTLTMWVDMFSVEKAKVIPMINIAPPPSGEFEVRLIIWGAKDVVFKDTFEKCSDVYVQATLGKEVLETDTHWRCRGVASYNYRLKFIMKLPLDEMSDDDYGKDILNLSLWDRDIIKSNEMIGETSLTLNTHKMLKKAFFRNDKVTMKRLNEKSQPTDRFWLTCFHPKETLPNGEKKSQGKIELSIEIMPQAKAKKSDNGQGRDAPNRFPLLPEPTGRFHFNIFDPWQTFKDIVGPGNARKCVCYICSLCMIVVIFYLLIVYLMLFHQLLQLNYI